MSLFHLEAQRNEGRAVIGQAINGQVQVEGQDQLVQDLLGDGKVTLFVG